MAPHHRPCPWTCGFARDITRRLRAVASPAALSFALLVVWLQLPVSAQNAQVRFRVGTVIPKVTCNADPTESYSLYLPTSFSPKREWPILYLFDPFGRGTVAAEVVQAAAEKFGYIAAASNNSRNGPRGGSRQAAIAMWDDTQLKLPVDPHRRYVAGLSGGARVAASVALSCGDCVAGVIANGAGFPPSATPPHPMKFAYFAAVGNADFSYAEFGGLRRELDRANARYRIRVFEGSHGWAPNEVWNEALNWMDLLAMAKGDLPRDDSRIKQNLKETLARARALESDNDALAAFREYQWAARDLGGLADVSAARTKLVELENSKPVKVAEKRELAEADEQRRLVEIPSAQMQKLFTGDLDAGGFSQLLAALSKLKSKAELKGNSEHPDSNQLVLRRALSELVVRAFDSGQICLQNKDYDTALAYFHLAAAGSSKPGFAHYQRARACAMSFQKQEMLAELRLALSGGFHEASALDTDEFQPFRRDPDFQSLAADWQKSVK